MLKKIKRVARYIVAVWFTIVILHAGGFRFSTLAEKFLESIKSMW